MNSFGRSTCFFVAVVGVILFVCWRRSGDEFLEKISQRINSASKIEVHAEKANSHLENDADSRKASGSITVDMHVTEEEIAICYEKGMHKKWSECPENERKMYRNLATMQIQAQRKFDAGLTQITPYRDILVQGPGHLTPLVDSAMLAKFVAEKSTPGAYIAAAGADRDTRWIDYGLEKFPGDPQLLRAKAVFNFDYLRDASLIESLRSDGPVSGWADMLSADVALGQKQPKSAFESVKKAIEAGVWFSSAQEIQDILTLIGGNPQDDHFARDIGNDGTMITDRMADEFLLAAKGGLGTGDSNYYAGASLALYDLRSSSSFSEEAKSASENALKVLQFLGPEQAEKFLNGNSYEEVEANYQKNILTADSARREATEFRATLEGKARADFDRLRNLHGSSVALQQTKSQ